jgi:phytoene synthase
MAKKIERDIFKNGSTTYYFSSKFFPKGIRDDVFKLYSFVRVVDDYVDMSPADIESFKYIVRRWQSLKKSADFGRFTPLDDSVAERVLGNICYIVHRFECDPAWVDSFLRSMAMDVRQKRYLKIEDTMEYMYGSAEVIGLLMAKTMRLPNAATHFAKQQGRAMQFINFLRDIAEDNELGRCYFPANELKKFGLSDLSEKTARDNPKNFEKFIRFQLKRYKAWQNEASKGFQYIPKRLRIPLRTAVDMYDWTAKQIEKDPFVVFEKKVKPKKGRVVRRAVRRIGNA